MTAHAIADDSVARAPDSSQTLAVKPRLVAILLSATFALGVWGSHAAADGDDAAQRRGNVLALRKPSIHAVDHQPTVDAFARLAATNDSDALFGAMDDVSVRANGELAIRHYLNTEVIPFFADYSRLDGSMRVTTASFEDGTEGLMAYAYAVTASGQPKPFVVAWRSDAGALRVMDVQVGRCIKARHPVAPGHCDR